MRKRGKLKATATIGLLITFMAISAGDSAGSRIDMELESASASFIGEGPKDYSGQSVAIAGDVNGDGYDDILIGTPHENEKDNDTGQTYLILGKASGWSMYTNLSNADASFWGDGSSPTGDRSGASVAGAGDVNGDGYDDILIGAREAGNPLLFSGRTYLILGKASGWSRDTNLSKSDASFWGEWLNDNSGASVAGAGDVNGDGFDDILIGAPQDCDGGQQTGQTYLVFGKASGWSMDTKLSEANASFQGEGEYDQSGWSVAGAGDVNSDGYDDILIGCWAGRTYLILGKASGWSMDANLSNADASFWGEGVAGWSGLHIAGTGDVNGDGFDDILIGAHRNDEGGERAGQTYLILGKASGWFMDTDLSDSDASFVGENEMGFSGFSVAGAGDVNSDGYDDILIGAPYGYSGVPLAHTYIILGKASGWSMDTDLAVADVSYWGEDSMEDSGYSVAGAGDVNGDGYDDILIGARRHDHGGLDAGQTYLIFGGFLDTDNDGVPDLRDAFPEDIAASLDTDGDGFPDMWNPGMSADDSTSDPKLMLDAFPDDITEWADTDADGYGDNGDAFPDDPLEWNDIDGDAHGDNGDIFPNDPLEWVDTDSDGSGDNGDAFPDDAAASVDTDGDGYPDEWNTGKSQEDSTTGLKIDELSDDPKEWKKEEEPPGFGMIVSAIALVLAALVLMMTRKRR